MDTLTLIIMGVIQGIFEWIPISSQGIITIILTLLGNNPIEAMNYAIFLHGGTALAAIIYYRKEFKEMLTKGKLLGFIVTVTLLTLVIAAPLYLFFNYANEIGGLLFVSGIGVALIITGTIQSKKKVIGVKEKPSRKDAIITGIMQGFSIIPGISRSGMTISTLLFRGFKGETAIKLSFLLSVPAVLIAEIGLGILNGTRLYVDGLWGLLTAFFVGLIGIKAMTNIAKKVNFGVLCIIIGSFMAASSILKLFL